jgi:hypothetical protein
MAKYQRVSPRFWQDPKVRRWGDQQKLLAQYFLTCPHRTTEGLFWLPRGYIAQDLGWGIDTVFAVLGSLIEAGFVAYDEATETVFLCKALKYEAPAGPKQIQGAISRLADVPPSPLFAQLRGAAEKHAPEFCKALDDALAHGDLQHHRGPTDTPPKGYPNPIDSSSSNSSSSSSSVGDALPSLTGVDNPPAVDNPVDSKRREGKGRAPRTPRHPTDDFVVQRARQIQVEDGPAAARAYLRKVGENYGQASREDQLRRLEAIIAQDAAEAGEP